MLYITKRYMLRNKNIKKTKSFGILYHVINKMYILLFLSFYKLLLEL